MLTLWKLAITANSFESRWVRRLAFWAISFATAIATIGCDIGSQINVERVSVSGRVTLDGQPLQAGAILFHSNSRESDEPRNDGNSVTAFSFIENGAYAINIEKGPAVGSARVEFRSKPLQREELEAAVDEGARSRTRRSPKTTIVEIPEKYGAGSTLRVELISGDNRQNFTLKSQPNT